jgi:pimeloyl-ACP methyl ester carboxylesterase
MSGYYYPSARADVLLAAIPALPIVGDVDRYSLGPLFGLAMRPMVEAKLFAPANVASSWKRFPFAMTLRPSQLRAEAAEAALMIPSAAKMSSVYEKLTIPVTIVSGEGDQIVDHASQSAQLAAELPAATFTTLNGVGHMVHHTATDLVIRAIQQTLKAQATIDEA